MKKKSILALFLCLAFTSVLYQSAIAQDGNYAVHINKDFGYNMGSDIQGRFTIRLLGDVEKVSRVTFYIDDAVLKSLDGAPFSYPFQTAQFEPGVHQLFAEILLNDGNHIQTAPVQYNFLSQKEANRQLRTVLIGIGGAIIGAGLLVVLIQMLVINKGKQTRHQPGTPRNYGLLGGTICRKCGRPFPRHIWGINLVVGRLDRCDNCGKWVMTTRASAKALQEAEQAEKEAAEQDTPQIDLEKRDKDLLEETKYFEDI